MNTKILSRICSVGLSGSTAALLLASQAHAANSYSIPLAFTIGIAAPTCTLTLGDVTLNAGNSSAPISVTGVNTINLTPVPYQATATPNDIVSTLTGTTPITTDAPGVTSKPFMAHQRKVVTMPSATATCSPGTPMTARLHIDSSHSETLSVSGATFRPIGQSNSGQSLNVSMVMGITSFGGTSGASGDSGTTFMDNVPTVATQASGTPQLVGLAGALYSGGNEGTQVVGSSRADTFAYKFSLVLDF